MVTSVSLDSTKDIPFPTVTICGNEPTQKWTIVGRMLREYDRDAKMIMNLFRKNEELSKKLGTLMVNMGQFYHYSSKAMTIGEKFKNMDVRNWNVTN